MGEVTGISWSESTWNPVIGCTKVSPGCDHCYAIKTAHRMQANPNAKIQAAYGGTEADGEWTGQVNLVADRLDLPIRWTRPRMIFVNSQSDLFHEAVPAEFIAQVYATMALAPQHTFQVLTKRHARMRALLAGPGFADQVDLALRDLMMRGVITERQCAQAPSLHDGPLPNLWLGVSVEDQKWADIRVPALLRTPAAVRWLSMEPLLGPVTFRWAKWHPMVNVNHLDGLRGLDWIVLGGESGTGARPMAQEWIDTVWRECAEAEVPFHFKQAGKVLAGEWGVPGKGEDPAHWPVAYPREYPRVGTAASA